MESYDRGFNQLRKLLGEERANAIVSRFRSLSPAFEKEAISVVFGRTWARETLEPKTRALCSICILAALGRQNALKINFELALKNGATVDDIIEALLQVAIYAGYPAALDALSMLDAVLAEMPALKK